MGDSMSTIINATTTNGVVIQPDNSGSLVLQTNNGTTALTVDTSQNVAFAKGFTVGATAAPAFSAYNSAATALSAGTTTKVLFATEEFDTNSNFASSRFTPTVAGYYQLNASVFVSANNAILLTIITQNTGNSKSGNAVNIATPSQQCSVVSTIMYFNGSSDYAEVFAYSGSAVNTFNAAQYTYFQGALIRSA
jgi:hypothetical protein